VSVSNVAVRWVVVAAALALAACGRAQALDPAAQEEIEGARALAERAVDEVRRFEPRVALLERRVAAHKRAASALRDALVSRSEKLDAALRGVERRLERLAASNRAATKDAEAALSAAEAAARDLAILTRRFDYHLRRYHGGG
jgi:uncharacterized coiled-coil protein SlyX